MRKLIILYQYCAGVDVIERAPNVHGVSYWATKSQQMASKKMNEDWIITNITSAGYTNGHTPKVINIALDNIID